MCGTCGRKRLAECTCGKAAAMRGELAKLTDAGKSREEVYQYFMAQYGSQEPLASPVDEGFNRLAWMFPWAIGATGAVMVGFAAMKWSRRGSEEEAPAASETDAAIDERLDDELRNLD